MTGFIVINKPKGITSHDVVNKVRQLASEKRVGHGGTLDPMATGILVIGIGREATKHLGKFSENTEKTYQAIIRLGATSETDDAEGMITESELVTPPKKSDVTQALKKFKGSIKQAPPTYSAAKVSGVESYKLARQGTVVNLGTHQVEINSLHIEKYVWPRLSIEVECSSGTYIRALARDIGEELKTGGYLEELVRTKVGKITLDQSIGLDDFSEKKIIPIDKLDTLI
ncbi:tRNA pseudouridine(55) synthase TruB [Patescibacteria group bacterium]